MCECVFRISSFKNEQEERELINLVYFKYVIHLNDWGVGGGGYGVGIGVGGGG